MTQPKTGPLTKNDFVKLWTSAMDRGYTRPLVEGGLGNGYEVWDQSFDQAVAMSAEIDVGTQGLYINPHSSQTAPAATGAVNATVTLTLSRKATGNTLSLAAGQFIDEIATDHTPTGGSPVRTGRRYFIAETTFGPGETTRTTLATAERPGLGGNYPMPGTISFIDQVGQNRAATGANVVLQNGTYKLQAQNIADTVVPQNVGSYVLFTGGVNNGRRAWVIGYEPPDLTVPDGGKLRLAQAYTLEFVTLTSGPFLDGELVTQGSATASLKRFYNPGTGKFYLTFVPLTSSDVFNLAANITGVISGAVATATSGAAYVESPNLAITTASGESWKIQDMSLDYGLLSTNLQSPSGGRSAQLDALGANHDIQRGPGESDDLYRERLAKVPDFISPNSIRRNVNRFLTKAGFTGCILREPGLAFLPTFYGDRDAADYDPTSRSHADLWRVLLSYEEFRAFFIVEVPAMDDGEFGVPYDATGPWLFPNAYDANSYLVFYDGYAWNAANRRRAIWQAVNQARAAGVSFDIVETPPVTPIVSSIAPPTGTHLGGVFVTITGQNFFGDSHVQIGGVACTSITVVSANSITCLTPALAAGVYDVTVTDSGGNGALLAAYTST